MANSYPTTMGPPITFWLLGGSYQTEGPPVSVDTSFLFAIRVSNYVQRPQQNIGVVSGKVYNTEGTPVTLNKVSVGLDIGGPFTEAVILSADPEYSFPTIGTPTGEAFTIPIEIPILVSDYLFIEIEMGY